MSILRRFSREARAHRRTRSHLTTRYGANHAEHVTEALDRGVSMDVLVALHDTLGGDKTCTFYDSGFNHTVRALGYYAQAGGTSEHAQRMIDALRTAGRDVVCDVGTFAKQAAITLRDRRPWARTRDWIEEGVQAVEAREYHDFTRMMPRDIAVRFYPRVDEWHAILSIAQAYGVAVEDLCTHLPAVRLRPTPQDRFGMFDKWRPIARWQRSFGTERTALLLAAGLSEAEGYEVDDDTLAMLAALRSDASTPPSALIAHA